MYSEEGRTKCRIWRTHARLHRSGDPTTEIIFAARAGGFYDIERGVSTLLERDRTTYNQHFRARLTSWLIKQRAFGTKCPKITHDILKQIQDRKPLPVHERADHLLEALSKKTEFVGDVVEIQTTQGRQEELLAHCESTSYRELEFLLTYSLARLG